jgi:ferric-dicitrate binding protein FerR (iron transport regulator)
MNDKILIKYLLKEAAKAEMKAVEQWISAHPDNELHYRHVKCLWEASAGISGESRLNEDEAWKHFLERRKGSAAKPIHGTRFNWFRMAAACFFAVFCLFAAYFLLAPDDSPFIASRYGTKDEVRVDTLADGSVITMNKNSQLIFSQRIFQRERIVEMKEGEAFFRVKPDKNKPFIIRSGDVTITVVGTSFHVCRKGDQTEVIVESGLVKVETADKKAELKPHEKIMVNAASGEFKEEKVTDRLHNYYVNNRLELDNTPLWRVAEVLEEAYGVQIRIIGDDRKDLRLTTTFELGQLNDILEVIGETFDISITREDSVIILK